MMTVSALEILLFILWLAGVVVAISWYLKTPSILNLFAAILAVAIPVAGSIVILCRAMGNVFTRHAERSHTAPPGPSAV